MMKLRSKHVKLFLNMVIIADDWLLFYWYHGLFTIMYRLIDFSAANPFHFKKLIFFSVFWSWILGHAPQKYPFFLNISDIIFLSILSQVYCSGIIMWTLLQCYRYNFDKFRNVKERFNYSDCMKLSENLLIFIMITVPNSLNLKAVFSYSFLTHFLYWIKWNYNIKERKNN